jgi:hypothetical protein
VILLGKFNDQFEMSISELNDEDSERNKSHSEQYRRLYRMCEARLKIMGKRMSNQLFKSCGSMDENPIECLQKDVVLGHDRNRKCLFLNINNMML